MIFSTLTDDAMDSAIPRVTCPRCGTRMRLAELLTDLADHEAIFFDCSCGFEYRMSTRVASSGKPWPWQLGASAVDGLEDRSTESDR